MHSFLEILEILLIGIGLSMDALAVSLALGANRSAAPARRRTCLLPALFFGGFQALMPICGYFAGNLFASPLQHFGRYLASALIAAIGGKMLFEKGEETQKVSLAFWSMTLLAIATSIDALFVGVSFACLARPTIFPESLLIGCTTAAISAGGYLGGQCAGRHLGTHANLLGGGVLLAIALKILLFDTAIQ